MTKAMTKAMTSPEARIESALKTTLATGHATHCFAECGFLDSADPVFRIEACSDERDIFDLASLTKALVTAPLLFSWHQNRNLPFSTRILDLGIESDTEFGSLSIDHLLSHRSGLPAWWNFWLDRMGRSREANFSDRAQRIHEVLTRHRPFLATSGHDCYSDIGFILLGHALESSYGQSLESLFDRELGKPLGLTGPYFVGGPESLPKERAIPTGYCPLRGRSLIGEVHDENCYGLGGFSGHAGLFGSGLGVSRLLREAMALDFWRNYGETNASLAKDAPLLGLRRADDPSSRPFGEGKAIGHMGFTGTAFWIDFGRHAYAIFLTNRIVSGRMPTHIKSLRAEVFGALDELVGKAVAHKQVLPQDLQRTIGKSNSPYENSR